MSEVKLFKLRELPDFCWQGGKLVVIEEEPLKLRELPNFFWQGGKLVVN